MRRTGQQRLPNWRFRRDRRLTAGEARHQADDNQGQHSQSEHEMPGFQPLTYVGSLGVVLPEQDGRINGGNQQHRDPVESDRQGGETLTAIDWIHCKPHIHVSSWEQQARNALFLIKGLRSEEHTSELQSLMRISYAVFCLKQKTKPK